MSFAYAKAAFTDMYGRSPVNFANVKEAIHDGNKINIITIGVFNQE